MTFQRSLLALASLCLFLASQAQAAPVTSLAGSELIQNPQASKPNDINQSTSRAYAPGITWTSDVGSAYGFSRQYGFQDNGLWYGQPMIGLGQASGTMTLSFDTAVAGVGGFINYAQQDGQYVGDPATIAVYDANHNLLDSAVLDFDTGRADNAGFFYGFNVGSALISSFTLSGAFIGLTNLEVLAGDPPVSDVPEPASAWLVVSALLLAFGTRRSASRSLVAGRARRSQPVA